MIIIGNVYNAIINCNIYILCVAMPAKYRRSDWLSIHVQYDESYVDRLNAERCALLLSYACTRVLFTGRVWKCHLTAGRRTSAIWVAATAPSANRFDGDAHAHVHVRTHRRRAICAVCVCVSIHIYICKYTRKSHLRRCNPFPPSFTKQLTSIRSPFILPYIRVRWFAEIHVWSPCTIQCPKKRI